jgi:hypothetical protein
MNVDRAEIHLPKETDPYSEIVYKTALSEFQRLQSSGALVRESEPCIYLYQQTMGNHVQTGVACFCHFDDYEQNIIKKHEKTRKDKEDDRTRLIDTLSADTGPVFLTYRDHAEINRITQSILDSQKPVYNFTAPDGIRHTVWRVEGGEAFVKAFAEVPVAYVADGHHRTASAVRVGRARRQRCAGAGWQPRRLRPRHVGLQREEQRRRFNLLAMAGGATPGAGAPAARAALPRTTRVKNKAPSDQQVNGRGGEEIERSTRAGSAAVPPPSGAHTLSLPLLPLDHGRADSARSARAARARIQAARPKNHRPRRARGLPPAQAPGIRRHRAPRALERGRLDKIRGVGGAAGRFAAGAVCL